MPDFNAFQTGVQQFMGPYELPAMIFGAIIVAVWLVLAFRALQIHNQTEVAQLDRMLKHQHQK